MSKIKNAFIMDVKNNQFLIKKMKKMLYIVPFIN